MTHILTSKKVVFSFLVSIVMIFAMSTTTYATEIISNEERTVSEVLTQINSEYGTNIHILSKDELEKYGLTKTEMKQSNCVDIADLEATLRYLAEFKIPEFEKVTQYARSFLSGCTSEGSIAGYDSDTVIATKAIDYATAAVEAYTTTDSKGNKKWGSIVKHYCITDISRPTSFMASSTTATRSSDSKAINWSADGDYMSNINGTYYYLYSGTQYASLKIEDYT